MEKLQTAQNHILWADKLGSIQPLAAGVCNKILNPINIICGHAQGLQMKSPKDLAVLQDLDSIMDEVSSVKKILTGPLNFSREETIENKEDDLSKNEGKPDRIRQVFLNIINKALYAMIDGGALTIPASIVYKEIAYQRTKTDVSYQTQTGNESAYIEFSEFLCWRRSRHKT